MPTGSVAPLAAATARVARRSRPRCLEHVNNLFEGRLTPSLHARRHTRPRDAADRPASAFAYGELILVGQRVRLRSLHEADLPVLAGWEMDAGRMTTGSDWVGPPPEAAGKERMVSRAARIRL